jgi:hypothetical protein
VVKKVGSRRFTVTAADSTGAVEVSWQQAKEEGASHQRPPPRFNRSLSEYVLNNPPSISNRVNGVKGIESTSPPLIAAYVFDKCSNISSLSPASTLPEKKEKCQQGGQGMPFIIIYYQ